MDGVLNALMLLGNFVIVPGMAYGAQLALGALGVTLVYGVLRFSNFAHGETMSFGAMAAILVMWALQAAQISIAPAPTILLALPAAILVTVAMLLLTDRAVYRFYRRQKAKPVVLLIVSTGVMFVMAGLVRFVIGPDNQIAADGARFLIRAREMRELTGLDQGIAIRASQVISILAAAACVAALFWFLNRTRDGKAMRAFSDNEDLALLSGVNPERVVAIAWILTAALATLAGALYALDKTYTPFVFQQLLLPVFAAAIVGGLGNPLGAVAGGFLIAFSEVVVTYAYKRVLIYASSGALEPEGLVQLLSTEYKFAVSFIILVIVLLVRPTGMFRGKAL
ncbi:MAG: branched-chain amino acid ABC transporter permease [Pseudomonadota bacterium]